MKKWFIILVLCSSVALTFACGKDNGKVIGEDESIEKEEVINSNNDNIKDDDNEIQVDKDKEKEEKIIYKDDLYGFSLEIPLSWEKNYSVEKQAWIDEESGSVSFKFISTDIVSDVFSIIIIDKTILQEKWEDPFLTYIMEEGGRTFVYFSMMEPTEELLADDKQDELEKVTKMVGEVPAIIETFNLDK